MLHLLPHNPMQEAQRIKSGIRIFKSLQHDRIVTYFDSMEVNAVFCIFMEYMPGVSYGLNVPMHVDMHIACVLSEFSWNTEEPDSRVV